MRCAKLCATFCGIGSDGDGGQSFCPTLGGWYILENAVDLLWKQCQDACCQRFSRCLRVVFSKETWISTRRERRDDGSWKISQSYPRAGELVIPQQVSRCTESMKNCQQMSSVQNPCWLMIIGDYTTQYSGDSNSIEEFLQTNINQPVQW